MLIAPGRDRRLATFAAVVLWTLFGAAQPVAAPAPAAALAQTAPAGPLELGEVALVQRDVRMALRIVTAGGWTAEDLASVEDRAICVTLAPGDAAIASGRICVTGRGTRAGLDFTPLSPDGSTLATRKLAASVKRPAPNVLEATFLPAAAGLAVGPLSWSAQASWTDDTGCLRTCTDRYPATGAVAAPLASLGVPSCFGAAARDPSAPCDNPALRLTVQPPVARGYVVPPPYCDTRERSKLRTTCAFGAPAEEATGTFALVGDSHAAGLKPALQVATLLRGWRGVSILRSSCPATSGTPLLPTPERSRQCLTWNRQMLRWLLAHPEVDTVFLTAHIGATVVPRAGQTRSAAVREGYRDLIRTLVAAGRRVVVVRDAPTPRVRHLSCITRALREAMPPGPTCTRPRSTALRRDPLVAAARAERSTQVKVVDLTPHFCDERRCFAVVGGVLVNRDSNHLTPALSASLGPYLVRALG